MIDGVLAGENHRRMFQDVDFGLPELDGGYAFYFEELIEINVDAVLAFQLRIR